MQPSHWLDQYASKCFNWQKAERDGITSFYRPLGLVEYAFDCDGRFHEGRADISSRLDLRVDSTLDKPQRQQHVALAWSCLRMRHILAHAKAPAWQSWMKRPPQISHGHCLQIDVPQSIEDAIDQATSQITFVDDKDASQFFIHSQNCARVLNSDQALARLFVLHPDETTLSCVFIAAHEIGDGLSIGKWLPDFMRLLNMTTETIRAEMAAVMTPQNVLQRLPLAQEALYPPVTGSLARQRWFWLLTRILRHVRKPLPAGFPNPLMRSEPCHQSMQPQFDGILDYSRAPPTLSAPCKARMSQIATRRMISICRSAGVSIGAGCFALAAILMMEFYERREPLVALDDRKPFITGFPLNPRPFLTGNPSADSLMLAFSDGILLPFLPSTLDLEGRLRLLARIAQRQLAIYQKRVKIAPDHEGLQYMSSRGAGRMLAIQYLSSFERCETLLPADRRQGSNPQGAYPTRPNLTRQTCGVSSLGRLPSLNDAVKHENPDFIAKGIDRQPAVRARDGEFLIAISSTDEGIAASVSVDDVSMDPALVEQWLNRFECILEGQISAHKL